jgi:hypothetical protein
MTDDQIQLRKHRKKRRTRRRWRRRGSRLINFELHPGAAIPITFATKLDSDFQVGFGRGRIPLSPRCRAARRSRPMAQPTAFTAVSQMNLRLSVLGHWLGLRDRFQGDVFRGGSPPESKPGEQGGDGDADESV